MDRRLTTNALKQKGLELLSLEKENKGGINNEKIAAAKAEIAEIQAKLAELRKQGVNIEVQFSNVSKKKLSSDIDEILEATAKLADQVASLIGDIFDRQEQRTTASVDKQKSSLDDALANSKDFTAQQIQLERERLDKLEKEQRSAAERARIAQLIQVGINTVVAVTKAASQTGVGAPIAILSTLAAIAGGIAAANQLAGNAFWEGTDYVPLGSNRPGRDTVPARLTEGEAVLDREDNRNYHPTVKAIRRHMIPANVLNEFVQSYRGGSQIPRSNIGRETAGIYAGSTQVIFNAKLDKLEREAGKQTDLLSRIERQGRAGISARHKRSSAGSNRADRFV